MITEPATSNVINVNGGLVTDGLIRFAVGFGHALGKKVKLINIGTPLRSQVEGEIRERLFEWYGI